MKNNFFKYFILIILLCFMGLFSIYLTKNTVSNYYFYFYRQLIYIIVGIVCFFVFSRINYNYIKSNCLLFYVVGIFLLIYTLFFGNVINGSRSWISLFGISIQPSEFVKIILLICIDNYIKTKYGLIKSLFLLIVPSILTFLQPDTGTVLFYLVIFISIFISLGLNKKYYFVLVSIIFIICFGYFYIYFNDSELFIDIFGTSFFYRTDRIINFLNSDGFQINNSLIGIGNGKFFGNWMNYVIYIPEVLTDFMFANILIRFGYFGGLVMLFCFVLLDFLLTKDIRRFKNNYFVVGVFGLFIYQQIQHIFMNIGLLPITGITLPFVSYGGSSLISYFILFGILFNIKKYHYDT